MATDLDEGHEILHRLDNFRDGEVFEHVLADADDFPHFRLVEREQQR